MSRTDAHTPWWVVPEKLRTYWINGTCGCRSCTGHYEQLWERRWWRKNAKRALRDARKYHPNDRADIDPYPRYAPPW